MPDFKVTALGAWEPCQHDWINHPALSEAEQEVKDACFKKCCKCKGSGKVPAFPAMWTKCLDTIHFRHDAGLKGPIVTSERLTDQVSCVQCTNGLVLNVTVDSLMEAAKEAGVRVVKIFFDQNGDTVVVFETNGEFGKANTLREAVSKALAATREG